MSRLLRRRTLIVSVCSALLGGSLVGFAAGKELDQPAPWVAAAEVGRTPLPAGSAERGRAGLERSALRLAVALDAVPVRGDGDDSTRFCPADQLRVRWSAPLEGEFSVGGHVDPVGPSPEDTTTTVNGLVVCQDASYAYMGFEAHWTGAAWSLASVPALSDEHDLEQEHEDEAHGVEEQDEEHEAPRTRPASRTPTARPAATPSRGFSVPQVNGIDPYAAYDPQRACDPVAKPGTTALRDLLLRTHPNTRSLGVARTCSARGVSEHKEGRAFDWGVNIGVPTERAAAESVLSQLLATDASGNRHALARRLGVMYMIWDRQIWSAYSADRGWRPYNGANAHTDHVHLSLSWDGAMGRTSYWKGANATLLQADPELRLAGGSTSTSTSTGHGPAAPAPGSRSYVEPRKKEEGRSTVRTRHERLRGAPASSAPPTSPAAPASPASPATAPSEGAVPPVQARVVRRPSGARPAAAVHPKAVPARRGSKAEPPKKAQRSVETAQRRKIATTKAEKVRTKAVRTKAVRMTAAPSKAVRTKTVRTKPASTKAVRTQAVRTQAARGKVRSATAPTRGSRKGSGGKPKGGRG